MNTYSKREKQVLTQLQRGIELSERPFQCLETLDILKKARSEGLLRRFGGIFDSRRLGYQSMLCALDVPDDQLDAAAAIVCAHPGVTHCYERRPLRGIGSYPALWFTLSVLRDAFEAEMVQLNSNFEIRNSKLLQLPALRRFRIDVIFDLHPRAGDEAVSGSALATADSDPVRMLTDAEKELVRTLDQELPLAERPFAAVAEQIGQSEAFVLTTLQAWKEQGVLRRVGAILHHREAGFKANAMCVWPVDGDVTAAGRRVAARPEVTHCYQRPRLDAFPFDLYAMIHTPSWEETAALCKEISEACGLSGEELFASGREFKKTSMRYFREE